MATFDDKSIFFKKEENNNPDVEEEMKIDERKEIAEEEINDDNSTNDDFTAKIISEEFVESAQAKKNRENQEKKDKKLQEKQRKKMIRNHRKAMKKNPENIKRYDTDIENGLPDEVVERRFLDELVNATKKGSTKSRKRIVFSNIFTFFNMLTIAIAIWLMSVQAWTDLVFLVIVTLNVIIGIYQELRAKKTIDYL